MLLASSGFNGGMAPFYGIRAAAREAKYRICTWDNPGYGRSDYLRAEQNSTQDFMPFLMEALKEKEKDNYGPKYIYVG